LFWTAYSLRHAAFIQTQAKVVAGGRSQICQAIVQIKNEGSRYQSAERDGRIAALKPPERIAADKKSRGHVACGDTALAPREGEVTPQLAKRTCGGQRHGCDWLRHDFSVVYNSLYVNQCLIYQTLLYQPTKRRFSFTRFGGSPCQIWRVAQFIQYAEQIYSQFKIARHSYENFPARPCRCVLASV
jgi:hypothetical protein